MKLALVCVTLGALTFFVPNPALDAGAAAPAASDAAVVGLAEVYGGLADAILANKRMEKALVNSILKVERDLVFDALAKAKELDAGGRAMELQTAARHIGEFATEGGAIIEPVRNKLLQGGHHHHHHHADESDADEPYDKGYVVVTKQHKRRALDLAKRCAKLVTAGAKDAQIDAIHEEFKALVEGLIE